MKNPPRLRFYNRQRKIPLPLAPLRRRLEAALPHLSGARGPLPPTVDISLVGLAAIARVHARFFNDPAPTDVITFPHGEILICPEIAHRQARAFQRSTEQEVLLYGLHGLLHLLGWNDRTAREFSAMRREQERLFRRVAQA